MQRKTTVPTIDASPRLQCNGFNGTTHLWKEGSRLFKQRLIVNAQPDSIFSYAPPPIVRNEITVR